VGGATLSESRPIWWGFRADISRPGPIPPIKKLKHKPAFQFTLLYVSSRTAYKINFGNVYVMRAEGVIVKFDDQYEAVLEVGN
jgi:hypothetical protein